MACVMLKLSEPLSTEENWWVWYSRIFWSWGESSRFYKEKRIYLDLTYPSVCEGGWFCSSVPLHESRWSVEHSNDYFYRSSVLGHNGLWGTYWFLVNFRSAVRNPSSVFPLILLQCASSAPCCFCSSVTA